MSRGKGVLDDTRTFMITPRIIFLRVRNVSDKSCRETQNTHLMSNKNFPRKSCLLLDNVDKIQRYSRTGQR